MALSFLARKEIVAAYTTPKPVNEDKPIAQEKHDFGAKWD